MRHPWAVASNLLANKNWEADTRLEANRLLEVGYKQVVVGHMDWENQVGLERLENQGILEARP